MLITDSNGEERWRLEGYLPKEDFWLSLDMGLARVAFVNKRWADAEERYDTIIQKHRQSRFVPEAIYYRGVSRYSSSHDHTVLGSTANDLKNNYEGNEWQVRSIPWLG